LRGAFAGPAALLPVESQKICGIRLVEWRLKEPPVLIECASVVVNPPLFARTTLAQLGTALANPTRWVGWTVEQLIDRLAAVGVVVILEPRPSYNVSGQGASENK
jgi:hypothetical protein